MKLLIASDLHYVPNLAEQISTNQAALPASTYNHQIDGKLYWHNQVMVEAGEQLLDGLERLARQEQPDLLLFLGDMVNINWHKSIAAVAARFNAFPCPVRQVLGNHDIYLGGVENRLQDAITPGTFETGVRHEKIGGLGLIYLDLFVRSEELSSKGADSDPSFDHNSEAAYRKWTYLPVASTGAPDTSAGVSASTEAKEYRPQDIAAALAIMAGEPETPWLVTGHYPFLDVAPRVIQTGRKISVGWPSAAPLAAHLQARNNLVGILCGHLHLAHFQAFVAPTGAQINSVAPTGAQINSVAPTGAQFDRAYGFHWHLPALVEYPCAAALIEWDGTTLHGRIVNVDAQVAAASLHARQASWTAGEEQDREFVWRVE